MNGKCVLLLYYFHFIESIDWNTCEYEIGTDKRKLKDSFLLLFTINNNIEESIQRTHKC